jgi:hypothetical protein
MFFPGKPFFLCCGNDLPIAYQGSGGIMIEGRYSDDLHGNKNNKGISYKL